jgi:hypothetical protein
MISNHDEGDEGGTIDDPVTVGQAINAGQTTAGITPLRPLSANEYQPADRWWAMRTYARHPRSRARRGSRAFRRAAVDR